MSGGEAGTTSARYLAPAVVADLLGLVRGETAVVRRRVVAVDGDPCEFTDSYCPLVVAQGTGRGARKKIPVPGG